MVTREVDPSRIEAIRDKIVMYGKCDPLSLQYDVDVLANGNRYILRVQMVRKHKLVALQAVQWWYDKKLPGGKGYKMLANDECLSALMVMLVHQYSDEPTFIGEDAETDISKAVRVLDGSDMSHYNIMKEIYKRK